MPTCSALALFAFALLAGVDAWGVIGHQSTAAVAANLLSAKAAKEVNTILAGETLVYVRASASDPRRSVATWADDVRSEAEWKWSAPLHFINTKDYACDYNYAYPAHIRF